MRVTFPPTLEYEGSWVPHPGWGKDQGARPRRHGMLAYDEAHDGEDQRRARRPPASRGGAERADDLRDHARGARVVPGRRAPAALPLRKGRTERVHRYLPSRRGDPPGRGGPVAVLVDAGPLYAVADENDDEHQTCVELLTELAGPLVVPVLVAAEVVQLLEARVGPEAEVRFVGALAAGGVGFEAGG